MEELIAMKARRFYRDSIEEQIVGPIRVITTSDGHKVESYRLANGKRRYFATLAGSWWCAHGDSIATAISDAIWKNPTRRPSLESLVKAINKDGRERKITLNEFRVLTGACLTGCRTALSQAGRDETPLTAKEIRDLISRDWGNKLLSVLGWMDKKS
jgi:hypothetical protein